ncbi:hypothetical protein [Leadbettera azotonutricia]|uniref:Uncharacterized protein n=1 Tax=Leadbettera azotonutricia (strain ATCC BAA-888 / DSM 13862 / ZAS-9) TaxID=545695 RepID=F5YBI0_LEAAZ|nr:hypothetical protein [Leadbettera azotonutricia]AEF82593.1 hypothetical protein TREAZ_0605 [Leadbettera azotonutricia ZAS-9]
MKVPKQKRIPVNVSLPVDFYEHLESLWRDRWNRGHTMLRFREFVAEMIGVGFQVWEERNIPRQEEAAEAEEDRTNPADDWEFDGTESERVLRYR